MGGGDGGAETPAEPVRPSSTRRWQIGPESCGRMPGSGHVQEWSEGEMSKASVGLDVEMELVRSDRLVSGCGPYKAERKLQKKTRL